MLTVIKKAPPEGDALPIGTFLSTYQVAARRFYFLFANFLLMLSRLKSAMALKRGLM